MKTRLFITTLGCLVTLPVAVHAQDISYTYFDGAFINNGFDVSASESFAETIALDTDVTADVAADMGITVKDGDGFALRGSWGFHPNWHVFAGYADHDLDVLMNMSGTITEMDATPADFGLVASTRGDITDWQAGLGYNFNFTPNVSGFVQVSWDNRDVDFDSMSVSLSDPTGQLEATDVIGDADLLSVDNDGLGANVGLRGKVTDWLELNGHVRYSEIGGIDLMADGDDTLDSDTWVGVGAVVHVTDTFAINGEVEAGDDSTAWGVKARLYFGG